ncbi:MAG: hypothetical protein EBX41_02015 [Chitinophagia bacterium]|nr:hypothetical protein [Chitinophagia bacterium]
MQHITAQEAQQLVTDLRTSIGENDYQFEKDNAMKVVVEQAANGFSQATISGYDRKTEWAICAHFQNLGYTVLMEEEHVAGQHSKMVISWLAAEATAASKPAHVDN